MTVNHKIWGFPSLSIESQVFHVPGSYFDGGLTSGGARIMSPEPGGRSVLEVGLAYQVGEWNSPFSSWLMSKVNGAIFRIQLIKTPQLTSLAVGNSYKLNKTKIKWDNDQNWDNDNGWNIDGAYLEAYTSALEGSLNISINMNVFGEILKHGHVIGFGDHSYIIEDIEYSGNIANITVSPPFRKNIFAGEPSWLQPYFLGSIANGEQIKNSYDAANVGGIKLNKIIFNEVVI